MHETRALAQFVAATQFSDLPASVLADCKMTLLDACTAGLVGTRQPWAQRAIAVAQHLGGKPEATVIAQTWQTDVARAAFANGVLIGALECEPLTGSHASGTVLPAVLAVCQRDHLNGKDLLTAFALGAEVSTRLARTAVGLETVRGFHNPGVQGPLATALAVGKLLGCDVATLTSALGLAGSCCGGLLEFAWNGADTKRLHLGRASQLGLESALLAQQGLRGPETVIEGRYGYYNAFAEGGHPERLLDSLGHTWMVQPASLKSYPTHVTQQAVVQALQGWRAQHRVELQHVTRVVIRGAERIMEARHTLRTPENVLGGQYSLPFTAAVALARDLSTPFAYDDTVIHDPQVRALAQRVELLPDESQASHAPGGYAFHATIMLEYAGQQFTLHTQPHQGSPQNPFTWAEVMAKLRRYTAALVPEARATALCEAVEHLEELADAATLMGLLAGA